ncbi:MAG: hypothetical protein IJO46_09685 [Thermoguttaceae bacterium]|nr:hypothetical protein [Thermoguttaceae bacterium]
MGKFSGCEIGLEDVAKLFSGNVSGTISSGNIIGASCGKALTFSGFFTVLTDLFFVGCGRFPTPNGFKKVS